MFNNIFKRSSSSYLSIFGIKANKFLMSSNSKTSGCFQRILDERM